jgi:adsorption protein B
VTFWAEGEWAVALLFLVVSWVLLSALDDLFIQLALVWRHVTGRREFTWPSQAELHAAPQRRIAILVALWHEDRVIERMLRHNLKVTRHAHCDFFVGVYPNDPRTRAAVSRVARRHSNVKIALNPRPGPSSKGDCLNAIFQRLQVEEERTGARYDVIVIHDAEDLIHPEEPRLINYFSPFFDMVQVPVLPLPTPAREWTHGLYCDEFAEFQLKDIPVRQMLGGFVASNGVGTGFSRKVLERLAAGNGNRIFEPASLAEDYQIGLRIHQLRCPQVFLNLGRGTHGLVATREYFPRNFRAALAQRTRWVTGIALQSWARFGWKVSPRQYYWLWRDRKGLVGNLLTLLVNLLFLYGAAAWAFSLADGTRWQAPELPAGLRWMAVLITALTLLQTGMRMWCCAHIFGWRFAVWSPLRAVWGNGLNGAATVLALYRFFSARLQGNPLAWAKTEHIYPSDAALAPYSSRSAEPAKSSATTSG